ncbi:sugar ABC transporter permease [Paenibacillus pectinilyticus]|uniref:Sugar ABC transporter permease n=1 Tax=Paenibacillus pectinilyticus TaxID=512399 RepID=A0A1C0ZRR9_9BACL|nr:carbohydrate ABC transporter permease [Paenibacillus pectinilyticus]OCT10750.1 sugar ABC transporter permease [Paenibacillus pectinilyticus]
MTVQQAKNASRRKSGIRISTLIMQFFLIVFAIIQLFPLVWLFLFSLKDNADIFSGNVIGFPKVWHWENYSSLFAGGKLSLYFINSLIVTFATMLLTAILATMAAYSLSRMKWKLSKVTLTVFMIGLMIPIHAALLPVFLILKTTGLLDTRLALILPYTGFGLSLAIIVIVNFFVTLPRELEESAFIDGSGIYRTFASIMMPLVAPAIATVSIFTYLSSWNELMFAITFISSDNLKTLTVGIMSLSGQHATSWGPIGAGLFVSTLPTIILYLLMSSQVERSLTVGAVKG